MKILFAVFLIFATGLGATAQQVSPKVANKNWKKLTTIPAGKRVRVKTAKTHVTCAMQRHNADSFTCTQNGNDLVFHRTDVLSIKVVHGHWEWVTSPWFVVPVFSGGVAAIAGEVPHGDAIAGGILLVLMGFVLLAHLA